MKRTILRRRELNWAIFLLIINVFIPGTNSSVLCLGTDGQVAIELAGPRGRCLDGFLKGEGESPELVNCFKAAPCLDISLVTETLGMQPSVVPKEKPAYDFLAHPIPPLPVLAILANGDTPSLSYAPQDFDLLRTVVLLI